MNTPVMTERIAEGSPRFKARVGPSFNCSANTVVIDHDFRGGQP